MLTCFIITKMHSYHVDIINININYACKYHYVDMFYNNIKMHT